MLEKTFGPLLAPALPLLARGAAVMPLASVVIIALLARLLALLAPLLAPLLAHGKYDVRI